MKKDAYIIACMTFLSGCLSSHRHIMLNSYAVEIVDPNNDIILDKNREFDDKDLAERIFDKRLKIKSQSDIGCLLNLIERENKVSFLFSGVSRSDYVLDCDENVRKNNRSFSDGDRLVDVIERITPSRSFHCEKDGYRYYIFFLRGDCVLVSYVKELGFEDSTKGFNIFEERVPAQQLTPPKTDPKPSPANDSSPLAGEDQKPKN